MITDQEKNFAKYNTSEIDTLGQPYDYGSIMHYGPHTFAIGHTITIEPKIPGVTIGHQGLSTTDIKSKIDVIAVFNCMFIHLYNFLNAVYAKIKTTI